MRGRRCDLAKSQRITSVNADRVFSRFLASDFFAAIGRGDGEGLLAPVAEDIEWIIPGEEWPLAGAHRGHTGLADLLETASKSI